jgi:hypothetical protein
MMPDNVAPYNLKMQIQGHAAIFATVILTDHVTSLSALPLQALRRNKNGPT